ncbi:unnamed protein product [Sphagnum troendelagicum]
MTQDDRDFFERLRIDPYRMTQEDRDLLERLFQIDPDRMTQEESDSLARLFQIDPIRLTQEDRDSMARLLQIPMKQANRVILARLFQIDPIRMTAIPFRRTTQGDRDRLREPLSSEWLRTHSTNHSAYTPPTSLNVANLRTTSPVSPLSDLKTMSSSKLSIYMEFVEA